MPLRSQYIRDFCLVTVLLGSIVAITAVLTGSILVYPAGVAAGFWFSALWMAVTDPDALLIAP